MSSRKNKEAQQLWSCQTKFETRDNLPNVCQNIINRGLRKKRKKDIWYYNCPCAFDIETTSFYYQGEKASTMYIWQIGLNGFCFYGRTWDEFAEFINQLVLLLDLSTHKRLCVYAHNLSFEFEYICRRFKFENVFSLDKHRPCYALTDTGIEFRCSYILSNYSLASLAKNLTKYKASKRVGDLDYSKIRHSKTPLSSIELEYCLYDIVVVMCYIQECIEQSNNDITLIVLTNTGRVRKYCKKSCYGGGKYSFYNYHSLMTSLTLEPDEFNMLHQCFAGGFTHASALASGVVLNDVTSFDFCSAYPAMLIAKQYPMSKGEFVEIKTANEFLHNLKYYCCCFEIEFINIRPKLNHEHPISKSKCFISENVDVDNGRVISADRIAMVITEQDYIVFKAFYSWDNIKIGKFVRYRRGYLPTPFVKSIIQLYKDKTTLKDVPGKEVEYLQSKCMLNSAYGMAVTNPCRDEITFLNGEWSSNDVDVPTTIDKYNKSFNRFLFYAWGVWCTAYCRRSLFTAIKAVGDDYVYADTDSVKITNADNHLKYFTEYNENILNELKKALKQHNIPFNDVAPQTQQGIIKPLGIWEREYTAQQFKTLGAKRYLYNKDDKYVLTVAGVNKNKALEYIKTQGNVFEMFNDGLYIPAEHTGKNIHTYIEFTQDGVLTDYLGNTAEFHEMGGVHIEPAEYSLSIAEDYKNLLLGIRERTML